MATEMRIPEMPRVAVEKDSRPFVAIVDEQKLDKAETLAWLKATELRKRKQSRTSINAQVGRMARILAEACSRLRLKINPQKEEKMQDSPLSLREDLAVIVDEIEGSERTLEDDLLDEME